MFTLTETGPEVRGQDVRFRIYLPGVEARLGFAVTVYVISKQGQFDPRVRATPHKLSPASASTASDDAWGDVAKTRWHSDLIRMEPGVYLYRFEITGPSRDPRDGGKIVRSLYFGDPCARETDAGVFSVLRIPAEEPIAWEDGAFRVPPLDEILLYELNVAEFGGTFDGVAERIPYLLSLGVNAVELLPINSIAEPTQWGYMPIFYLAPEERFGGPAGLRRLVQACHRNGIAVVLDMVYAHVDRLFPYQIGYEPFFYLWEDHEYTESSVVHRAPNPMVSAYSNFGNKNDWRMRSTQEFFAAVNAFWLEEYHVDGFRLDHVNGYLDRKPIKTIDEERGEEVIHWYSPQNRPRFVSLQGLSLATYRESKRHTRFLPAGGGPSRIIQIAEDLGESAYQLAPVSASATNGNWEKRLADIARQMAVSDTLSDELGKELLLADARFRSAGYIGTKSVDGEDIPALVVQYIESHDENRLFYLMQQRMSAQEQKDKDRDKTGYEYRPGLDGQPWWRLQPYAIALLTGVGLPMLWSGQEFAENTGLAEKGQVRVRGFRPLHWDYFYNAEERLGGSTVLPLVTLYRNLGLLRRRFPALRSSAEHAKEEYCDTHDQVLVYRRWAANEVVVVVLNFSEEGREVPVPFGHTGTWMDLLDASYCTPGDPCSPWVVEVADATAHPRVWVPGSFGRILRLT